MRSLLRLLPITALALAPGCQHRSADSAPAPETVAANPPAASMPEVRRAPEFAPSSRSPERYAIDDNAYGAFADAPDALRLGDTFPIFDLPSTGPTKQFNSQTALATAPLVVVFYRGHW